MKIKNHGLEYYLKTPYVPKVKPNLFFADKKVKNVLQRVRGTHRQQQQRSFRQI